MQARAYAGYVNATTDPKTKQKGQRTKREMLSYANKLMIYRTHIEFRHFCEILHR